ncbi:major facilitator superfamily transporter [Hypoxylon sp. FL0543]|nr:major facilitator superfamily transporter [Hypoxylon sp. FL0543]
MALETSHEFDSGVRPAEQNHEEPVDEKRNNSNTNLDNQSNSNIADPASKLKQPKSEAQLSGTTQASFSEPEDAIVNQQEEEQAATDYPSGFKFFVIIIGLSLAVLCIALDNTIVSTAIPKITDEFAALGDVGWYGSAYLLTLAASQLFFGRLYSYFSIKLVFLLSLLIFEVGSVVCGAAPSSIALIIGRAVAGIGASGLFAGAFIIVASVVPLEKRPLYISLTSGVYAIASVLGPLLGGVFTDRVSWRWCFYINLPFGAVTAVSMIFFLHPKSGERPKAGTWWETIAQYDPFGTLFLTGSIVCLLLALQWGGTESSWDSPRIIALLVVFAVLIIAFIVVQVWAGENATIPLRIAKQRSMAFSSLFIFALSASYFIMVYYIPIWFQAINDDSAMDSGFKTLPLTISVVVGAMVAGIGTTTIGYYVPFMYAAVILGSIGAGLIYTWTLELTTPFSIGCQILFGFGIGMGLQQSIVAAQTVLVPADIPTGTSIVVFFQNFGGSFLLSAAQTTFLSKLLSGTSGLPGITSSQVVDAGATGVLSLSSDPAVLQVIRVAYRDGLIQAYMVALILVCLSLLGVVGMEWRNVKAKAPAEGAALVH